jgi:hypothetical protein
MRLRLLQPNRVRLAAQSGQSQIYVEFNSVNNTAATLKKQEQSLNLPILSSQ